MNKKDAGNIATILASYDGVNEFLLQDFFELDGRIKEEYAWSRAWEKSQKRTHQLFNQMMEERYGRDWAILKVKPETKSVWAEAEEIANKERRVYLGYEDEDE